jgi:hypothetical protein
MRFYAATAKRISTARNAAVKRLRKNVEGAITSTALGLTMDFGSLATELHMTSENERLAVPAIRGLRELAEGVRHPAGVSQVVLHVAYKAGGIAGRGLHDFHSGVLSVVEHRPRAHAAQVF